MKIFEKKLKNVQRCEEHNIDFTQHAFCGLHSAWYYNVRNNPVSAKLA